MPRYGNIIYGPSKHRTVIAGGAHSLLITLPERKVIAFGLNRSGQLGLGHTNPTMSRHYVLELKDIVEVSAGHEFSVALDINGEVYTWGSNEYSQLGLGETSSCVKVPERVSDLPKIERIFAGGWHMLCLDQNKQLWSFGCAAGGRLGIPSDGPVAKPQLTNFENVTHASAGDFHSIVITNNREVRLCGFGGYGGEPVMVCEHDVLDLACGRDHSMILTEAGELFVAGDNGNGQLGLGRNDVHQQMDFVRVVSLPAIPVRLFCCYFSSSFVDNKGHLYMCGSNSFFECGQSKEQLKVYTFTKAETAANFSITEVAIGGSGGVLDCHIIARTIDNNLIAWGSSRHNQCGLCYLGVIENPKNLYLQAELSK
eukprot:TRINITY_DN2624_c0_g2_i1.p1 TRINITY_DN2624_c0_g2~~TRINITY_DN2624_c0_g2_i1.p1  ORF type:complete len:369 (-),score=72.76 TRINITY_DN2624_c0_g2_i1:31-1137(-)